MINTMRGPYESPAIYKQVPQTQVNRQTPTFMLLSLQLNKASKPMVGPMYPSFTKCYVASLEADNNMYLYKAELTNTNTYTIILIKLVYL